MVMEGKFTEIIRKQYKFGFVCVDSLGQTWTSSWDRIRVGVSDKLCMIVSSACVTVRMHIF